MLGIPLFPESGSTLAPQVDAIYFFGLAVAAFFSLLIAALIFYLALKFRRTADNQVGQPEKAGVWLEITWSVIPLAIMLFMFVWGTKVYFTARRAPANAVEYYATAKQWMWKFKHPEGNREINHLHVPVGQPIKLIMTSEDVIHSFFVPAFRIKQDVLPGRYTTLWFEATKTGTFRLFCAEYCGAEHSLMSGLLTVLTVDEYENWLAGGSSTDSVLASGKDLFTTKACDTCHRSDSAARAPMLAGIFAKERELHQGDVVIADENYLRESILDPREKLVTGYNPIMPTYQGQLTEDELLQLIIYIKTLKPEPAKLGELSTGGAP
jgi:cytochrome c oxidase subunit 2